MKVGKTAFVALVLGVLFAGALPARAVNTVSGSAFGLSATYTNNGNTVIIDPNPTVALAPDGGTAEGHVVGIDVSGVVSTGVLTADTTGTIGPNSATATSKASVAGVTILPNNGPLVTIGAVVTQASCTGDGVIATCSSVGTTILGLFVNNVSVLPNITPPPNFTLPIPLIGTLVLNEQTSSGNGVTTKSLDVTLIHLTLNGLLGSGDFRIGHAHADVDFTPFTVDPCACALPQNSVSGEAFANQVSLLNQVVEKSPRSFFTSEGGPGGATADAASANLTGTANLTSGTATTETDGTLGVSSASSHAKTKVQTLNLSIPSQNLSITADALEPEATCTGNGVSASCTAAGTVLLNLIVNGNPVATAPNTPIVIAGGLIVVNEQLFTGNGTTTRGLTVNSVHVYLTGVGDIIVASAHAEVDLTPPPPPGCDPCDDNNPCNGIETCDQFLGCQPGTPPSTLCTTTTVSTTTTTTLASCGDGQLQSPEQCDPPGSMTCPAPPGSPPLSCQNGCVCPDPCPLISFLVATTGKVGNSGQVTGGIGANNVGGMFGIGKGVFISDGSDLIADRVQIGRGSSVFHVDANSIHTGDRVAIRGGTGTPVLPLSNPFCPIPPFSCGGPSVSVASGQSASLTPGSYGTVTVARSAALVLDPGTYQFCSLKAARNGAIVTTGTSQSTIQVKGDFRVGNGGYFGPISGTPSPQVEIEGLNLRVGAQAVLQAFVAAPNALFRVGRSGQVRGTVCAAASKSDKRVVLICQF